MHSLGRQRLKTIAFLNRGISELYQMIIIPWWCKKQRSNIIFKWTTSHYIVFSGQKREETENVHEIGC